MKSIEGGAFDVNVEERCVRVMGVERKKREE